MQVIPSEARDDLWGEHLLRESKFVLSFDI